MSILSNLFGSAQGMGAQIMDGLKTELNLTEDQVEKVKAYFQQFRSEKHEAKSEGDLSEKMDSIKQEFKDHLDSILTDEQRQKLPALMEKYMGMLKM